MNSSTDQKPAPSEYRANLELLMQIPLFARIPLEALKLVAFLCQRENFKSGDLLFRQNEVDGQAFFIIKGTTELILENTPEIILTEFGEGQLIGGQSLFANTKRLFSLRAVSQVTCLILARDKFQRVLEQFPNIAPKMFEAIVTGIHQWESHFLAQHATVCSGCLQSLGATLV